MKMRTTKRTLAFVLACVVLVTTCFTVSISALIDDREAEVFVGGISVVPNPDPSVYGLLIVMAGTIEGGYRYNNQYWYGYFKEGDVVTITENVAEYAPEYGDRLYFRNWQKLNVDETSVLANDCTIVDCKSKTTQLKLGKVSFNDEDNYSWKVYATKSTWSYCDPGNGLPDPEDETEGLPYPDADNITYVRQYDFSYVPTVLDYYTYEPITTAQAGDLVWLKISVEDIDDIDQELAPYGFSCFEGTVTFDVENMSLLYYPITIGDYASNYYKANIWLESFMHLEIVDKMYKRCEMETWWAPYWIPDHCCPYFNDAETAGYGLHWGVNCKGAEAGEKGIYKDGTFYMCLPVLLNDDLVEGDEYTFTLPYPRYEQGGVVDYRTGVVTNGTDTLYARGGAYTITIKNHADVDGNIASSAAYIATTLDGDLSGEKSSGYLNDNRYPLTDVSDYEVYEGGAKVDMTFAGPASVEGAKITFNKTSATELPTSVTAYGVKADGTKVLLGSATEGVAYRAGTDETCFYDYGITPDDETSIHVNDSNAYSYSISGFEAAKYVGIYVEATAADGAKIAIGEIEVFGELEKINVTVENGTIINAADDDMYDVGTVLNIKADTIDDKVFTGWTVKAGGVGTFADANSAETTFTVGGADTVIVANYTDKLYDLTVVNGTGGGQYAKNSTVTIKADDAPNGQYFDHWEVTEGNAVVSSINSATTTVTTASGASTITAVYADNLSLTVVNGTGSCQCAPGASCAIKANTKDDYKFYKWVVTSGEATIANANSESTTVTLKTSATVTAMYVPLHLNVPDNLALDATLTLESGKVAMGKLEYINDGLYPLTGSSKFALVTGSIKSVFELDNLYTVDEIALTFALDTSSRTYLPSSVKVYVSSTGKAEDRQLVADISGLTVDDWTVLTTDECPDYISNFYRYEFKVDTPVSGKYIIIEYPGTTQLIAGETEIYGELSRFVVEVSGGSIEPESDDGKYLPNTTLTLIPDDAPDGKIFAGWTHCGLGTLDNENNTFVVGAGDAQISAVFIDMHKPVPDNIAPDSTFKLLKGTTTSDLGTTDASGWLTGGYINDQLYPLTFGAKWATISAANNSISVIAKLDAAYDISQVAVTMGFDPINYLMKPAIGIKVYGLNSESDSGVLLAENARADLGGYEQITFDQTVNLPVLAARYVLNATEVASYRYIRIDFGCMIGITDINFGEIEIYGSKSMFNVEVVNGTVTPSQLDNMYYPETVITIKADDLPDKVFTGWTVENSNGTIADASAAETTFTVGYGNNKITANYKAVKYKLTVNNGSGSGEYERYSVVPINADTSSDPEKVFDKWVVVSGKVVGITDPYSATTVVTTDGEAVVEATYKDRVYTLTVENGTGSGNYADNTPVSIVANAAPADMVFDHWELVTGYGTIIDTASVSTIFTTSNEPTTVRAVYKDILYSVTVNGGAIANPSADGYTVGSRLELSPATPDHKEFVKWELVSGNGTFVDATDPNTTFVLGSGNAVINAVYKDVEYSLTVENGTGSGNYIYESTVDISANVPEGFLFAGWTVKSGSATIADATSAETTVTVLGDAAVTAQFVEKEYSVDVINGTLSSEDETFKKGTTLTITADEPAANMKFAGWTIVSGNATIADASSAETTITVGNSDVVVRANYEDILYVLTVENGTGSGSYKFGFVVEISADKASDNMHFLKWEVVSGNATIADASSAETTVTMGDEAAVVRAVYSDDLYTVTVENGTATGIDPNGNKVGTVITITADEPEEGYRFDKWVIVSGNGDFADETNADTTFTLGAGDTVIQAQFSKITTPGMGDRGIVLYALLALMATVGTAVVVKKKQK